MISSLPSSTTESIIISTPVPPPIPSLPPPPPPPPPGQAPRLSAMNSNVHYRQPFTAPQGPVKGLHWHRIVYPAGAKDFEKSIWSGLPKARVDYQVIQKSFGKKHITLEIGKLSYRPSRSPSHEFIGNLFSVFPSNFSDSVHSLAPKRKSILDIKRSNLVNITAIRLPDEAEIVQGNLLSIMNPSISSF